ncbi:MAG: hypothetical protein AAF298_18910 [Cyanobacteria bacterium P01_A01_bin.40]
MSFTLEYPELVAFYQRESIPYELKPHELGFAVISAYSASATSFRELGQSLLGWKTENQGIKTILGLERLLEGKNPEVATWLLMIPFIPGIPDWCVDSVALLTIDSSAKQTELAKSLCRLVKDIGVGKVMSFEEYSYMNR